MRVNLVLLQIYYDLNIFVTLQIMCESPDLDFQYDDTDSFPAEIAGMVVKSSQVK